MEAGVTDHVWDIEEILNLVDDFFLFHYIVKKGRHFCYSKSRMPVNHNREKLLNAMVYFANHTKFCGKTKLYKLLYFLDFTHFKETGRSVTGLEYFVWERGPAPRQLHNELDHPPTDLSNYIATIKTNSAFVSIKAKKKFNGKYFTGREIKLLEQLCLIFKNAKADDMVEASHLPNQPWDTTKSKKGMYASIDFFLALDNSPESITKEEAKERILDRKQIESAFK